jgi:hypothetical protein
MDNGYYFMSGCPPSMLLQWRDELEARFGLTFEVLDRNYIERIREERGYGVNPWTTFPRFLVSRNLLIDETYAGPLRAWLDEGCVLFATYALYPPGVTFAAIDNGIYSVNMKARQLKDKNGRYVPAGELGKITVAIRTAKS